MVGLAWAAAVLAAAWVWHRHLEALVLAAVVGWLAMPGVARGTFALGPIDLHPAATLCFCVLLVQLVRDRHRIVRVLHAAPVVLALFAAVCVVTTLQTLVLTKGPEGVMFGTEQVTGSLALLVLVGACLLERPGFARRLTGWLLGTMAVEGLMATAQAAVHQPLLYASAYAKQYWFKQSFDRWMGTTDHPLVLSLMVVMTVPLLARRMNGVLRIVVLACLAAAMLAAQSRTGIAVLAAEVLFVLVRGRMGARARIGTGALVAAGVAVAAALGVFGEIITRLTTDDGGSAAVRTQSIEYIINNAGAYGWLGRGMNQSIQMAGAAGFGTSFENSFIMHMIDMGLPTALVYYGCMVACVLVGLARRCTPGAAVAGMAGILVIETFSALGDRSASAAVLWTVLGLALFSRRDPQEQTR